MRIPAMVLTCLLLWSAAPSAAVDEFGLDTPAPAPSTERDEVLLKDGTLLLGTIVSEQEDRIVFETASLGRMEILRSNIARLAHGGTRSGALTDPDYNTLMFCPTPATLAQGDHYFRDFELFILNLGTSLTDALDLSVGTLFPISSEVLMVSAGAKLRVLDRETGPLGLALVGSYTRLEEIRFGGVGFVAGVGDRSRSLNLALDRTYDDDGDTDTVILAGADYQTSRRSKVFIEYMSSSSLLEDEDDDLNGFLNVGLRLFGESHSFSLSGFRPLLDDGGSFIAWPMIMYSNHF